MSAMYCQSATPELYIVPPTLNDIEVNELSVFYADRDVEEELYWAAMETHNVWKVAKLKAEKAMEAAEAAKKKAEDRAKKLALLKAEKERKEAEAKRLDDERKTKEAKEEKERQRLRELEMKKPTASEAMGDEGDEGIDREEEDVKAEVRKDLLEKRRKVKGKGKVVSAVMGTKRKLKLKVYVPVSEEEESAGPSERPVKRVRADPSPSKGGIEYQGKGDVIEYPDDFIPSVSSDEWVTSSAELRDLQGTNPEALHRAMTLRLDQDVAQVWHARVTSAESFNGCDPFELANMELWHGSCGQEALAAAIAASQKFQKACKEFLKGSEEFIVEDSDGEMEPEEVREEMKPGSGSVGIADLDELEYEGEKPEESAAT
ncbi:hypothetical protein F5146DRAFT_1130674 [Armillaria mellea]|nr:hypothetical protein F5146DRAFT_1130674 [Armillaria mellea]